MFVCEKSSSCIGCNYQYADRLDQIDEEFRDCSRLIEVQEVRHGKWFFTDFYDSHKNPIYQCSVCMKEVADHYIDNHKYCLHCGAKMDLQ